MRNHLEDWLEEREEDLIRDIAALVEIESVAEEQAASEKERKQGRDGTEYAQGHQAETSCGSGHPAPYGPGCRKALERMMELAEQKGLKAEDHQGHCLSVSVGTGETEIGIWNHLDVVPAGEGWIYPPYACTRKNGYLIGRGVQDNKGPAVAVLYAIWYCSEKNLLKNIKVRQILGCQEERGMQDVVWYLRHRRAPDFSFVADCGFPVCCGEKGGFRITLETEKRTDKLLRIQGGTVCNSVPAGASGEVLTNGGWRTLEAEGIGGHAAFPEGTVNAVNVLCGKIRGQILISEADTLRAAESVTAVEWNAGEAKRSEDVKPDELGKILCFLEAVSGDGYGEQIGIACEDELSGRLTCNAGVVSMREGRIRLELDIRYPVTKGAEDFLPKLRRRAEESGFCILEFHDSPPYYMDKNHPFVQVLMRAWREETGLSGEPFVMGGGTYARHIPNAVSFGPGTDRDFTIPELPAGHGNCHCADEAEAVENLKQAVSIYVNTLMKIDEWIGGRNHEENENKR